MALAARPFTFGGEEPIVTITVYSQPSCVQCSATYRWLDRHGLAYEVIDVSADLVALAEVQALGYLRAPVVIVRDANGEVADHWSGLQP